MIGFVKLMLAIMCRQLGHVHILNCTVTTQYVSIHWSAKDFVAKQHVVILFPYKQIDAVAYPNAYFGSGSGPYHLDNVYCRGSEPSLISCSRGYSIGIHNCEPGNEAGVKCASKCMIPIVLKVLFGE